MIVGWWYVQLAAMWHWYLPLCIYLLFIFIFISSFFAVMHLYLKKSFFLLFWGGGVGCFCPFLFFSLFFFLSFFNLVSVN